MPPKCSLWLNSRATPFRLPTMYLAFLATGMLLLSSSGKSLAPSAQAAEPSLSMFIGMPGTLFEPGDPFSVSVGMRNKAETAVRGNLFVVLEGFGGFYFMPSFSVGPDFIPVTARSGFSQVTILPTTSWPNLGSSGTATWYAALLDPTNTDLLAGPVSLTWSFRGYPSGYEINPDAILKTGQVPGTVDEWILPNGRKIKPAGISFELPPQPENIWVSPDGNYVVALHIGRGGAVSMSCTNLRTKQVTSTVNDSAFYLGLVGTKDGRRLYASDGGSAIRVVDFNAGILTEMSEWTVAGAPVNTALSADENFLFVPSQSGSVLQAVRTSDGTIVGTAPVGRLPYAVALHPTAPKAYISNEDDSTVTVVDISNPADMSVAKVINVGLHPEHLIISADGATLYVTNSEDDTISVISTSGDRVLRTIDLRPSHVRTYGGGPNGLLFDERRNRLYVCEAVENKISVLDLSAGAPRLIGHIPTFWYPTAVTFGKDDQELIICSHRGRSSGRVGIRNNGRIQIVPMPTDAELAANTANIDAWNLRPGRLFSIDDPVSFRNPIPATRGVGSQQIKYVILLIKENKTYDALLGDWPKGDGDANNCLFCGPETVNLRALNDRFSTCTNYYSNAEASVQGHILTTSGNANVFVNKAWGNRRRQDSFSMEIHSTFDRISLPKNENLFSNCINHGLSLRVHGEAVGMGQNGYLFDWSIMHWGWQDTPFYNQLSKDKDKMLERIAEWSNPDYVWPRMLYTMLPNDHTSGGDWPFPTPESMVADNDEAMGMLVDYISRERPEIWRQCVIFITEDDPQQGNDRFDTHRTIMTVAGPWVKRDYRSPVHYSEANMHATIQYILGLPALTTFDENAQPMYDMFTMEPDYSPYQYTPRQYPEEYNPPSTTFAQRTKKMDFRNPDEAEGLQELIWDMIKTRENRAVTLTNGKPFELNEAEIEWNDTWLRVYAAYLEAAQKAQMEMQEDQEEWEEEWEKAKGEGE